MGAPQIIMIILVLIWSGINVSKCDDKEYPIVYLLVHSVVSSIIIVYLLMWGGFFNDMI